MFFKKSIVLKENTINLKTYYQALALKLSAILGITLRFVLYLPQAIFRNYLSLHWELEMHWFGRQFGL
jgi:hypothetical protein